MRTEEALTFWNPWWSGEEWEEGLYQREELSQVAPLFNRKEILSISGIRRCGKTTLLHLLVKDLLKKGVSSRNIFHLNFEDPVFKGIPIYTLYQKYMELMDPSGKVFLFFDEVQEADDWEREVRKLYDGLKGVKITVTGSNSSLLKGDYATLLTGRTLFYELYPLSFRDFAATKGITTVTKKADILKAGTKLRRAFKEYLKYGGFPEVAREEDPHMKNVILKDYYTSILTRDVLRRYPVRQAKKYEKAAHYLLTNFTSPFSAKGLSPVLDINVHTIDEYIGFLEDVYLLFPVNHFSYSLKMQITYPRKVYCVDSGIINAASFKFSEDTGRLLENMVFTALKRAGRECYYWKGKKKCDFVVREGGKATEAMQVTYSLKSEDVRKREMAGLIEALEGFNLKKGLILTEDEFDEIKIDGRQINVLPVWYWLLAHFA